LDFGLGLELELALAFVLEILNMHLQLSLIWGVKSVSSQTGGGEQTLMAAIYTAFVVSGTEGEVEYVETAPDAEVVRAASPPPVEPRADIPMHPGRPMPAREEPPPGVPRREYARVSDAARRRLIAQYSLHGDTKKAQYYAASAGIRTDYCRILIRKLRNGESIEPTGHRRGRHPLISLGRVDEVATLFRENPQITLDEAGQRLALEGGRQFSKHTVRRFIKKTFPTLGLLPLTIKRIKTRPERVLDPDVRQERIDFVRNLCATEDAGYFAVYVDETSWRVGGIGGYGWAPNGEPCIVHQPRGVRVVSTVASLTARGPRHALVVQGTVNSELFEAYIRHLIADVMARDNARNIVIILDNAAIHTTQGIRDFIAESGHRILFNAPYSPALNPIELLFGVWKRSARRGIRPCANNEEFLGRLQAIFAETTPEEAQRIVRQPQREVWAKVNRGEDI